MGNLIGHVEWVLFLPADAVSFFINCNRACGICLWNGIRSTAQTHIVQPLLYANVIIIVMLASNIWSSLAQHVNQPEDDSVDFMSNAGQHMDGGEVIASRLPMLNEQEPSCEELRAMWRYKAILPIYL